MPTRPPEIPDLDAGWEEPEPPSKDEKARATERPRPEPTVSPSLEMSADETVRQTLPPPVPMEELVARMMSPETELDTPSGKPASKGRSSSTGLQTPRAPSRAELPRPDELALSTHAPQPVAPRRPVHESSDAVFEELGAELFAPPPPSSTTSARSLRELDEPDDFGADEPPRSTVPRSRRAPSSQRLPSSRRMWPSSRETPFEQPPEPSRGPSSWSGMQMMRSRDLPPKSEAQRLAEVAAAAQGPPSERLVQVRERFEAGDYSGALIIAEGVLDEHPDHIGAMGYAESCREMLRQMYLSRIGDSSMVPRIVIDIEQLQWLNLDHRAGFLLSRIDGISSIDDILDACGMPPLDALRILYELLQEGAIQLEESPPRSIPPRTMR